MIGAPEPGPLVPATCGPLVVVAAGPGGRRVILFDSLTHCDARVGPGDVLVAGSFAGTLAFGFALAGGARGLVAHAAGVGLCRAGIAGLELADQAGVPAVAVATYSARLGDGWSVWRDGRVEFANRAARRRGVSPGLGARTAAWRFLAAPRGRPWPAAAVDRTPRVVWATPAGRVVLVGSTSFAARDHAGDVLVAGSHGGRVNMAPVLALRPRGLVVNDGGGSLDDAGVAGLDALAAAGIPAVAAAAASAAIGDPASAWATGLLSVANTPARALGCVPGQTVRAAALRMLGAGVRSRAAAC